MGLKYYQLQIMNVARREYVQGEQNVLGYMEYDGNPSIGSAPVQKITASSRVKDFYTASSDLGSRKIISTRVKELLDNFRNDNVIYLRCPLTRGSVILNDFWITDVIKFDDQEVDFERSIFKLCEGWVEKEVNGIATEFGQKITDISFQNLEEMKNFEENKLNYLSYIITKKLVIKEGFSSPLFFLKIFGVFDFIVCEEIKDEILKQKMDLGVEFKPLEIPDEEWFGSNGLRKQFYK
ncbi:hypothetical protein [Algoriphagus chordae]|uniref:Uncharacterized protein n=1 Tax=Algoriphagus chordae TaxID=237019 RepID=A0A2W7QNJ6_9BACT|nr:hypothetical protein [Algoriphagus chordae]PZX49904.1 hypothetical protein LV85_02967 [Algoriphagus chordae]